MATNTCILDDDNQNDSGIISSTPIISSGISQNVEELDLNSRQPEGMEDQQLGDKSLDLTVEQENTLLGTPSSETIVTALDVQKNQEIETLKRRYDEFIQSMMQQTPPQKRKLLARKYEMFKNGQGKNDIFVIETN